MTLPLDAPFTAPPAEPPSALLASRVARIRTRASAGGFDRGLLIVGGLLLPLGVLVIVLGWMGTAQTVLLFEQIPYLVSGGFLGLALVFVGGFVYFTYWQTLSVREARIAHQELLAALSRLENAMVANASSSATGFGSPASPAALVATAKGTMAHRPDCAVVAARHDIRPVVAADDYELCRLCRPGGEHNG